MRVEKYYCDFCGIDITDRKEMKDFNMSGEIVISKDNGRWSISSYDNCHSCFHKVYNIIKDLKKVIHVKVDVKSNEQV
jgi:hypothetical protein